MNSVGIGGNSKEEVKELTAVVKELHASIDAVKVENEIARRTSLRMVVASLLISVSILLIGSLNLYYASEHGKELLEAVKAIGPK